MHAFATAETENRELEKKSQNVSLCDLFFDDFINKTVFSLLLLLSFPKLKKAFDYEVASVLLYFDFNSAHVFGFCSRVKGVRARQTR